MTCRSESGVSPVIAVILMVAVTVVLSAAIGAFVFDLGQSTNSGDSGPKLGVQTEASNGTYSVQVVTGTADKLQILVNGNTSTTITDPTPGDIASVSTGEGDKVTVVEITDGSRRVIQSSTSHTAPLAPTDSLVAHYPFEEGSGTTAYDAINSNDGSLVGGTSWDSSSKVGEYTLFFDGSDDYVSLGTNSFVDSSTGYTISAWINIDSGATQNSIIGGINGTTEHVLLLGTGNGDITTQHDGSDDLNQVSHTVSLNTWHHAVMRFNGSHVALFINGNEVNSESAGSINGIPDEWGVGASDYNDGPSRYFNGTIDDPRIYDTALTNSQVEQLYDATK